MRKRAPILGLVGLLLVVLAGGPPLTAPWAGAAGGGKGADGPTLKRTTATVVANVEHEEVSFCSGAGGEHFKVDLVIRGPITSNDPRLSGQFTGHVRVLVKRAPLDLDALIGHGRDDFVVLDANGTWKARGTGFFVFDLGKPLRGLLFATLRDGSTWISNFSVANQLVSVPIILDDTLRRVGLTPQGVRGRIIVEMGGPITFNPSDPGLIQAGSCPGGLGPDPLRDPPIYP